MIKAIIAIISFLLVLSVFAGCSGASQSENKAAQGSKLTINDILASSQAQETTVLGTSPDSLDYPELDYTAEVDLTVLNSNMVYSTVYNMVNSSEDYLDKTVKASGTFDVYTDPNTGQMYYACLIADAAACCSQGLEFSWKGDHKYPQDYPQVGDPITVGGVFETYEEDGVRYCRLKDAQLAL